MFPFELEMSHVCLGHVSFAGDVSSKTWGARRALPSAEVPSRGEAQRPRRECWVFGHVMEMGDSLFGVLFLGLSFFSLFAFGLSLVDGELLKQTL